MKKGITLVSLVITIVLLIILATVAITIAMDSNGLFDKATDAVNKWNDSIEQQQKREENAIAIMRENRKGRKQQRKWKYIIKLI